ncbi:hypothetical protein AB0F96_40405 [Streptomyces sp. NPDC023998]|uniref:hypothetical protein n=1 Tax=Streptomyces sp. NPDC023998 TaxID=3154597 RepID=UPI0033E0777A
MLTELALPHRVIPGIAEFARGGLPAPAATDDGNEWVDGFCWLYCGQQWTRVLWIGPASVAGAQAPMYACGPCIRTLHELVWQSILLNDEPARPEKPSEAAGNAPPSGRRTGRHRGQSGFLRRR